MNPVKLQALGILVGMITSEKLDLNEDNKKLIYSNIGKILGMIDKDTDMDWRANYSVIS